MNPVLFFSVWKLLPQTLLAFMVESGQTVGGCM
jgi:hypothetical protein